MTLEIAGLRFRYHVLVHDPDGNLIAEREFDNLVTDAGANLIGNIVFGSTAKSSAWYLGLKGAGAAAAANTASSHAGWSEVTAYSETVRQTLTLAAFSGRTANNSASPDVFTINANGTVVDGIFCIDNSTKGGTTGTLYSVGSFGGGELTLNSGAVLTVNGYALAF